LTTYRPIIFTTSSRIDELQIKIPAASLLLIRLVIFMFICLMMMCACSSSSSNDEPYYTGRYYLFSADSGALKTQADGSFTLKLSGDSIKAAWIKEKTAELIYGEENPSELVNSTWPLQYGDQSPNAIILFENTEGINGFFLSLSKPQYSEDEITFNADWIGGTVSGITPPAQTVPFTDMVLILCNEDDGSTSAELSANEIADAPSTAATSVPAVYSTSGTGIDPMVALAFANINFSETLGQLMANQANDMNQTINSISALEGNKNTIRSIQEKITANQLPDDANKASLTALGLSGYPSCSDISSSECKSSWSTFLSNCMDSISGRQQQFSTRSTQQQLQLQMLMLTYNTANQTASNMIASLGRLTDAITGNIGR